MAYVDPEKKEDELGGQPVATGPEGAGTLGGSGAAGVSGNAADAAASTAQAGASGQNPGNFVGIRQYLDANKSQSEGLAKDLGGYVNKLGDDFRNTLPGQQNLYNEEVDKNTVNLDNDIFKEAQTNTVGVAQDAAKKSKFQKMRDAEYKGPQSFETTDFFKPVEDNLNRAKLAGERTATEQGQKELLQDFSQQTTGKQTKAGVNNFDQMLLQSGGGREELAKAKAGQADFGSILDRAKAEGLSKAQQAAQTTAATKKAVADEFGYGGGSGQQKIESALQGRAAQQLAQAQAAQNRVQNAARAGEKFSDQDLALLGVSKSDYDALQEKMMQRALLDYASNYQRTSGTTPVERDAVVSELTKLLASRPDNAGLFKMVNPETQINAQNVASADEYARYSALNDLMGTSNKFLSDPSQAGKANLDAIDLDYAGAMDYLNQMIANTKQYEVPMSQANGQYRMPEVYRPGAIGSKKGAQTAGIAG